MTLIGAGLLSLAGLAVWMALRRLAKPDLSETTLLALMLGAPLLALTVSGGLAELSGFGLAAKFRQASASPVSVITRPLDPKLVYEASSAGKEETAERDALFQKCYRLIVLKENKNSPDNRNKTAAFLSEVIRASISCGTFIGVVVIDERGKYLGSFPPSYFFETGAIWARHGETIPAAEYGDMLKSRTIFGAALADPARRLESGEGQKVSINERDTLGYAFNLLKNERFPFAAVTDASGKLVGVTTRDDIRDALLNSLINPEKS